MEFCPKGSLYDLLMTHGTLKEEEAFIYFQ